MDAVPDPHAKSLKACAILVIFLSIWLGWQALILVRHGIGFASGAWAVQLMMALAYAMCGVGLFTFRRWGTPLLLGILPYLMAHQLLSLYICIRMAIGRSDIMDVMFLGIDCAILTLELVVMILISWYLARRAITLINGYRWGIVQCLAATISAGAFFYKFYGWRWSSGSSLILSLILVSNMVLWLMPFLARSGKGIIEGTQGIIRNDAP